MTAPTTPGAPPEVRWVAAAGYSHPLPAWLDPSGQWVIGSPRLVPPGSRTYERIQSAAPLPTAAAEHLAVTWEHRAADVPAQDERFGQTTEEANSTGYAEGLREAAGELRAAVARTIGAVSADPATDGVELSAETGMVYRRHGDGTWSVLDVVRELSAGEAAELFGAGHG